MQRLTGKHGAEYRAEQELQIQSMAEHTGPHTAIDKLRKTLLRGNEHLIRNRIQRRIIGRKHHTDGLQTKLTVEKTALNALQYRQQTVFRQLDIAEIRQSRNFQLNAAQQIIRILIAAINRGFRNAGTTSDLFNGHRTDTIGNHNRKRGLHNLMIGLLTKLFAAAMHLANSRMHVTDRVGNHIGNGSGNRSGNRLMHSGNHEITLVLSTFATYHLLNLTSGIRSSKPISSSGIRNSNSEPIACQ